MALPVGFIGLGALGAPMAANLLAKGFALTVHNRHRKREMALAAAGARRAATPAQAAQAAQGAAVLALCLSDDIAVAEVLLGQGGDSSNAALAGLAPGALVVDFSTIAPATSRAMAAALAKRGVAYLDAPVTGGTEGARAGSLSVLVGGGAADLERARPVLEAVGRTITHLGPVGAGQEAKACCTLKSMAAEATMTAFCQSTTSRQCQPPTPPCHLWPSSGWDSSELRWQGTC